MSYPSLRSYIKTLRGLLRRKSSWLAQESILLADLCLAYGTLAGLTERERKTLFLAAHFKNLGAIFLEDGVLQNEFQSHQQVISYLNPWFVESSQLAREAGLTDVSEILDQYYHRAVPHHKLAKIFQVLNAWVACRHRKAWRPSMSEKETLSILEQRAQQEWSDPYTVYHFIEYFQRPQPAIEASQMQS